METQLHRYLTAKSFYNTIAGGGKIKCRFTQFWKAAAPPTTRIFFYLLIQGRLLTHDVMRKRGMICLMHCPLCRQCPTESALHLFFLCPIAIEVWRRVSLQTGLVHMNIALTVHDVIYQSMEIVKGIAKNRMEWSTVFICAYRHIWKNWNAALFDRSFITAQLLVERILNDSALWLKYCNKRESPHQRVVRIISGHQREQLEQRVVPQD
jgi:zinc-binding in reverse transcriptase